MPLLSRFLAMQQATSPLAALTQPQQTPQLGFEWQSPSMLPQAPQLPQGATAQTQGKSSAPIQGQAPGGFWGRMQTGINGLNENPLFNLGLSLLAGSQNGGDWGVVADRMGQYGRDQRERQMLDNEMRRQKAADNRDNTIFGRQQTEWQNQDQQRQRFEAAVNAEQDPTRRAQLLAIGPEGYGQFLSQEQQMQFQARENQLNRDNDRRVAATRSANENSLGRYFQAMDAQTIGDLNQQSAQLQAVGLPQLYALRDTIGQAGLSLTGQPLDYNNRITLGRWFNGSSADRQTLEVWRAQILGPALETLRGLGAMSEREMDAAIQSFSNPNMTLGAAQQLIDQRIAIAERRIATANLANQYFQQYGGLTGAGPGWPSYLAENIGSQLPASTTAPPGAQTQARSQYRTPPPQAVADLRRDSSAQARREFDAIFGPGAAARALATSPARVPAAARGQRPGAF
jgi:hypothetical protein